MTYYRRFIMDVIREKICLKGGNVKDFEKTNIVLLKNEVVVVWTKNGPRFKVGDGETPFKKLKYTDSNIRKEMHDDFSFLNASIKDLDSKYEELISLINTNCDAATNLSIINCERVSSLQEDYKELEKELKKSILRMKLAWCGLLVYAVFNTMVMTWIL